MEPDEARTDLAAAFAVVDQIRDAPATWNACTSAPTPAAVSSPVEGATAAGVKPSTAEYGPIL